MKTRILLIVLLFAGVGTLNSQTPINSLHFDGSDDMVSASLPTLFTNLASNDFTVETWVKHDGSGAVRRLLFAQDNSAQFASILINSSDGVYAYVYNGSSYYSQSASGVLTPSTWTHLAITWDASTQTILIYANGAILTTAGGGSSTPSSVDNIMTLGVGYAVSNFQGELDEFRIWDVVRTDCQILRTMNSEFTLPQTNLITYYNFNEGVAGGTNTGITTVADFTANFDGTLNNFALTGATSNWTASTADITAVNETSVLGSTDVISSCDSVVWIDGITYTLSNNTATHTLVSSGGCDSIITLDLTINAVDNTVSQVGPSLTSNETGASYQWLTCPGMTPLPGDTNQAFVASVNGDYAVVVTSNGCSDTSACITVANVGLSENYFGHELLLYPNPNNGKFSIDLGGQHSNVIVSISDLAGRLIQSHQYQGELLNLKLEEPDGVYVLTVESENKKKVFRVVKE